MSSYNIIRYDTPELPEEIEVSDIAAYCPATRTIHLSAKASRFCLWHEIGHHYIHVFGGLYIIHLLYDWVFNIFPYQWFVLKEVDDGRDNWHQQESEKWGEAADSKG